MSQIRDHIRVARAYQRAYEQEAASAKLDGEDRSVIEWLQRLSFVHNRVATQLEAEEAEHYRVEGHDPRG